MDIILILNIVSGLLLLCAGVLLFINRKAEGQRLSWLIFFTLLEL